MESLLESFAALTIKSRPRQTAKPATALLELPAELLNNVLTRICYCGDQAAVIRTCKKLHGLMLPMLYHDVHLEVSEASRQKLLAFCSAKNSGLPRIGWLNITSHTRTDAEWACGVLLAALIFANACTALRGVRLDAGATFLKSQVQRLLSIANRPVEALTILVDIRQMQDDQASTSCGDMLRDSGETVLHLSTRLYFGSATSVEETSDAGIRLASQQEKFAVLRNFSVQFCDSMDSKRLRTLAIEFAPGPDPEPYELLFQSTTRMALASSGMTSLEDLSFHHGNFGPVTWINSVTPLIEQPYYQLMRLTNLALRDCVYCASLLQSMMNRPAVECRLKRLEVISRGEETGVDLGNVVGAFLVRFEGLESLIMSGCSEYSLPDIQSIARHSTTLKTLFAGLPRDRAWNHTCQANWDWVLAICAECPQLEQVALPLPDMRFEGIAFADDCAPMSMFEFGKGRQHQFMNDQQSPEAECDTFRRCLSRVRQLPNLVTLRILHAQVDDMPGPTAAHNRGDFLLERRLLLFRYILRQFHEAKQSQLSVVSFGRNEERQLHIFVGGAKLEDFDEKFETAATVSLLQARAAEPHTEILSAGHDDKHFLTGMF